MRTKTLISSSRISLKVVSQACSCPKNSKDNRQLSIIDIRKSINEPSTQWDIQSESEGVVSCKTVRLRSQPRINLYVNPGVCEWLHSCLPRELLIRLQLKIVYIKTDDTYKPVTRTKQSVNKPSPGNIEWRDRQVTGLEVNLASNINLNFEVWHNLTC